MTDTYLVIDAATANPAIALCTPENCLWRSSLDLNASDASRSFIPELELQLKSQQLDPSQLQGVVLGVGPGSYTGLRVASAIAQGLAIGWKCPLIGCCSLWGIKPNQPTNSYATVVDARIAGVYLSKNGEAARICPIEELSTALEGIDSVVSPDPERTLKRLEAQDSNRWQKIALCPKQLLKAALDKGQNLDPWKPVPLDYLRPSLVS